MFTKSVIRKEKNWINDYISIRYCCAFQLVTTVTKQSRPSLRLLNRDNDICQPSFGSALQMWMIYNKACSHSLVIWSVHLMLKTVPFTPTPHREHDGHCQWFMGHSSPSSWPLKCSKYSRTCVNNSTPTQVSQTVITTDHTHQKSWLQPHKLQRNLSWRCKLAYSWWPTVISQWLAGVKNVNDYTQRLKYTRCAGCVLTWCSFPWRNAQLRMSNYGAIELCDRVKTWLTGDPTPLWHEAELKTGLWQDTVCGSAGNINVNLTSSAHISNTRLFHIYSAKIKHICSRFRPMIFTSL